MLTSREKRATALFTPHLQSLAIRNLANVSYMSAKSSPAIIPPGASLGHLYLESNDSARLGKQLAVGHTTDRAIARRKWWGVAQWGSICLHLVPHHQTYQV